MAEDQGRTADSFSDDELKKFVKMYHTWSSNYRFSYKYNVFDAYELHIYSKEEQSKFLERFYKILVTNKEYLICLWKNENLKLAFSQLYHLMGIRYEEEEKYDKYDDEDDEPCIPIYLEELRIIDKLYYLIDVFPLAQIHTLFVKIKQDSKKLSDKFGWNKRETDEYILKKINKYHDYEKLHHYRASLFEHLKIEISSYDNLNKCFNNYLNKIGPAPFNLYYTTCNIENLEYFLSKNDFLPNFTVQTYFSLGSYKEKLLTNG